MYEEAHWLLSVTRLHRPETFLLQDRMSRDNEAIQINNSGSPVPLQSLATPHPSPCMDRWCHRHQRLRTIKASPPARFTKTLLRCRRKSCEKPASLPLSEDRKKRQRRKLRGRNEFASSLKPWVLLQKPRRRPLLKNPRSSRHRSRRESRPAPLPQKLMLLLLMVVRLQSRQATRVASQRRQIHFLMERPMRSLRQARKIAQTAFIKKLRPLPFLRLLRTIAICQTIDLLKTTIARHNHGKLTPLHRPTDLSLGPPHLRNKHLRETFGDLQPTTELSETVPSTRS